MVAATVENPSRPPRFSPPAWAGLALMVAFALLTRLPFFGHPAADFDEQLYSLIGRHLLAGELPYTGLWDRKPLGLFALYAAAHGLFGPGPAAFQTVALAACLAGGWLTFRLAARITTPATAAFAAALYPPLMAIYDSHSGQSEVFLTPLLAGMALAVLRARECPHWRTAFARHALAMALGGLALQVKYSALPPCLWFGACALLDLHRRRLPRPALVRSAMLFALLGLLPTLAAAALYAAHGSLDAFLFANFTSIGRRGALPLSITLGEQLEDFAPLAMLALAGVFRRRALPPTPTARLAAGWLLAGLASLFLSTTIYPYYFAVLVPAVILAALPLFAGPRGPWILAGVLAWTVLVCAPWQKAANARAERATLAQIAARITARPGCLFVFDGPLALYDLARTPLPTRFIYPDHLNSALEARALPVDPAAEVARIMARQPAWVITAREPVTLRNPASARALATALARYRLAGAWRFQQRTLELHALQVPAPMLNSGCVNSISKSSKLPPY